MEKRQETRETKKYYVYNFHWMLFLLKGYGTNFYGESEYYEGEWQAGERGGWGRMHYRDGSVYEGEWLRDKRSGKGLLILCELQ